MKTLSGIRMPALFLLISMTLFLTSIAGAQLVHYESCMTSESESPEFCTQDQARALFYVSDDSSYIRYKLHVTNVADIEKVCIHLAPRGESGPIAVWLYPTTPTPEGALIKHNFSGMLVEGMITDDNLVGPLDGANVRALVNEIKEGNAYVEIHCAGGFPGQLRAHIE